MHRDLKIEDLETLLSAEKDKLTRLEHDFDRVFGEA